MAAWSGEHIRGWMTARFRQELTRRPEPWLEVRGHRGQRLVSAVARIDALREHETTRGAA